MSGGLAEVALYERFFLVTYITFSLQEMTLPVLSMLHDVTQHHVFFIYHSDQRDSVDIILSKVMTSVVTSHVDFRFSTLDSIFAAHPYFSVEQVGIT